MEVATKVTGSCHPNDPSRSVEEAFWLLFLLALLHIDSNEVGDICFFSCLSETVHVF